MNLRSIRGPRRLLTRTVKSEEDISYPQLDAGTVPAGGTSFVNNTATVLAT